MELAIGFVIAFAIAVTGVGAGTSTPAPLLILFLHVPIELSVGTALAYSAIVKMIVVPVQIWRKQVVYRVVGWMLLGWSPWRDSRRGAVSIALFGTESRTFCMSRWAASLLRRPPGICIEIFARVPR